MKQDQATINSQAELEIRNRLEELREVTIRREELVRELNGFAAQVDYKQHDYDSTVHFDELFEETAEAGDLSYRGHRPFYPETFWIPSSQVC